MKRPYQPYYDLLPIYISSHDYVVLLELLEDNILLEKPDNVKKLLLFILTDYPKVVPALDEMLRTKYPQYNSLLHKIMMLQ